MKNSKWAHIESFAQQLLAKAKAEGLDTSLKDIAQVTKGYYDLNLTTEQVYQIIYRSLPKQEEDSLSHLSKLAERVGKEVNYTQEEAKEKWPIDEFIFPVQTGLTPTPPVHSNVYQKPGAYIVLGCAHAPAHNVPLFEGVKRLMIDLRSEIAGIVWLGDTVDCNTLSSYDRGKFTAIPGMTLDEEYKAASDLIHSLDKLLPKSATKIFMYGNHEDRYNRYMADMENAKRPLLSPEAGLALSPDYHIYRKWTSDYVTLGRHLDLMHGQYFSTHCAKKHIDNYRGSVMFAHTHRIQTYIEGSVGGFNIGWMGDPTSPAFDYMARGTKKQWQNGFAVVNIDEQGDYFVQQVVAHNNKFYFNGKKYA